MQDRNFKGHAALFVAYIIFGLNTPIAKNVLEHKELFSAMAVAFYRIGGAAIFFGTLSLFTKKESVPLRDLFLLLGASLFGIFINQMTFIVGLSHTSPINAAVITTTAPMMTMLLAAFFLKEPITWKKAMGVLIGAAGALLLIYTGISTNRHNTTLLGSMLCLLSTLSFAIYLSAFKKVILKYSAVTVMKWMYFFAAICCLPFCWKDIVKVNYAGIPANIYLQVLYVVALATFFAYLLIPVGQKFLRPTIVSMYNYIQPIVSSLVAVAIGMDQFGWVKGSATALVFLGVYIVTTSKSYAQLMEEREVKLKKNT